MQGSEKECTMLYSGKSKKQQYQECKRGGLASCVYCFTHIVITANTM